MQTPAPRKLATLLTIALTAIGFFGIYGGSENAY